jgi:hypothetical protein
VPSSLGVEDCWEWKRVLGVGSVLGVELSFQLPGSKYFGGVGGSDLYDSRLPTLEMFPRNGRWESWANGRWECKSGPSSEQRDFSSSVLGAPSKGSSLRAPSKWESELGVLSLFHSHSLFHS